MCDPELIKSLIIESSLPFVCVPLHHVPANAYSTIVAIPYRYLEGVADEPSIIV